MRARSTCGVTLDGGGGIDTITGTNQADTLQGNAGGDTITALDGNDHIAAKDNEADRIDCGIGTDTVDGDTRDIFGACEDLTLGVLRLTPKTLSARRRRAHPAAAELAPPACLEAAAHRSSCASPTTSAPVGQVTIRPAHGRIGADGAVGSCAHPAQPEGQDRPHALGGAPRREPGRPHAAGRGRGHRPARTPADRAPRRAHPRRRVTQDHRSSPGAGPPGRSPRPADENRNRQRGRP